METSKKDGRVGNGKRRGAKSGDRARERGWGERG